MIPDDPIVTCIVVRRNQSLSKAGLVTFLGLAFVLHLALGVLAGVAGWWPVVGFVGGVFVLLGGLVLAVMAAGASREVITVRAHTVIVEYGRRRPVVRIELDRHWARIEQRARPQPSLVLCAGRATAEIGRVLTDAERACLARRLQELIGPQANVAGAARSATNATV